jgi:hypothetical protein
LIEEWLSSSYPATCPHGRSICFRLEHKDVTCKLDRHYYPSKTRSVTSGVALRSMTLAALCICWGPTSKTGEDISAKGRTPT